MALSPHTRLGQYEVLSSLGAGGMGEVYRARDTRLNRDVALKILPAEVANDADRLARFRREAQLLAALNHSNIAHVYGLEESGGTTALVMELVDGEDLAKRIARGAIDYREALPIGRQIALALEAAHEAGIIHRDLKPANIKLCDDGTVKVLDFGLAKDLGVGGSGSGGSAGALEASPTITTPAMTQAGMILGTAAYMSPEQAKGRPVDKRTDVWAFGCVLYEMLTGTRAFDGEDVSDTLAAILRADPDWTRWPPEVSESVTRLVRGCLEKDRRARVPDIGVARYLLDQHASGKASTATPATTRRVRHPAVVASIAMAVGALIAFAAMQWRTGTAPAPPPTGRFAALPDQSVYPAPGGGTLAIASDASFFVFVGGSTGNDNHLVVRPLDQLTGTQLEGTGNARFPFVSPDNRWIGFFADGRVKKVAVAGGAAVTLCAYRGNPRGGTWAEDGTIIFGSTLDDGLQRVSAEGGEPSQVTHAFDQIDRPTHAFPSALPGGRRVLFTIVPPGRGAPSLAMVDLQNGAVSTIEPNAGFIHSYIASGHLVWDRNGQLQAAPFDLDAGRIVGDAVTVVTGLNETPQLYSIFAASRNGVLVYLPAGASDAFAVPGRTVVWVDRRGVETPVGLPTRSYEVARLSPDQTRIAVDIRDEERDIWIWDIPRKILSRLTQGKSDEMAPIWSADGQYILFSSNRPGVPNAYRQRADGAGSIERLTDSRNTQFTTSVSADGRQLAVFQLSGLNEDIAVVSLANKPMPVTDERVLIKGDASHRFDPELSPDGRWMAYHSNESGRYEVYVRPFPDVDAGRWQISASGGTRAAWSRDGKELFYLDADNLLTAVPVSFDGNQLKPGMPTQLLKTAYVPGTSARGLDLRSYDVSSDGRRFLMVKDIAPATQPAKSIPSPLMIVTNWMDELKRQAPRTR